MTATAAQSLIDSAARFAHPASLTPHTSHSAQDAILRVTAIVAGLETLTPAAAAMVDRRVLENLASNVAYDVQTARLRAYFA